MGRRTLAVLVLCFVLWFAPAGSASFERPWQNATWVAANPSIWSYGAEIWWNIPELHNSPQSIGAERIRGLKLNGSAASAALQAETDIQRAESDRDACIVEMVAAFSLFPAMATSSFLSAFSALPECSDYRLAWTGALGSSLTALEESTGESEKSVAAARSSYDFMVFAGLCDANYTWSGSEACAEQAAAFAAVDSGIKEGEYGKYALLAEYSEGLRAGLSRPTPDLVNYAPMMGLVWGEDGIIRSFDALSQRSAAARKSAESEFSGLLKSALSRRAMARDGIGRLEAERLDLVNRAPASYVSGNAGSVASEFQELSRKERIQGMALEEARTAYSRTTQRGYLAAAVGGMAGADEGYAGLLADIQAIEDNTEDVLKQQRKEAEQELASTERQFGLVPPSSEASAAYEEALETFGRAESEGTLGGQFAAYSKAAELARAARNAGTYAAEGASAASTAELEQLISRAEKDGINVAAEKEGLPLLKTLPPEVSARFVRSSTDSIISKARAKYEDQLLSARQRIYGDLSLAGSGAADLLSDAEQCDEGMFRDDALAFPEAIGKLARLKSCYAALLGQVSAYRAEVVGNAMSVSASPLTDGVELDKPATIVLDVVLANPEPYNASNAQARIFMGSPWPFMHSDIVSGKEGVESVRSEDGGKTLVLALKDVKPYDVRRVRFEKSAVVAHTVKRESAADGLGNGMARVRETISFELDADVKSMSLGDGGAVVDGLRADRPLAAGKHTLTSEMAVDGAYSETIANIRAYNLGRNSKVEYDVRIMPAMDLASVPVLLASLNDSQISHFDVSCVTGERVKDERQVSQTQYAATVTGLRDARETVLKASYIADGTDSFVAAELARIMTANLSAEARLLAGQARAQAEAGNYTVALELLEKSRAAQKDSEARTGRLLKERDELLSAVRAELEGINCALDGASAPGSQFISKLQARKTELERILLEAGGGAGGLNGSVAALAEADMKWAAKELAAFKKEAYSSYNGMKERFYLAGNTTTPQEFACFEEAMNRLEGGARLEYAVAAANALEGVEAAVERQEQAKAGSSGRMREAFLEAKTTVEGTLERYSRQAAAAKGTEYSGLFQESEKKVAAMLDDAGKAVGGDERIFRARIDDLNRTERRMALTLEALENESEAKLSILAAAVRQKGMDAGREVEFTKKLDSMRALAASGEYVGALRAGSAVAKELDSLKEEDGNGLMALGLTALAVLAAIAAYIVKNRKQEPKKLRKLPTAAEKPPFPAETPE